MRLRRKGLHFTDDIFRCIFLNKYFWIFKRNFTEICSLGSNWQYDSIGSDNGLALKRRQAIIWSNVGMFYWPIYVSIFINELTLCSASPSVGTLLNTRLDTVFSTLTGWFWSVNPTERWCNNFTRALVWAWFSRRLKCWIHGHESKPWWDFYIILIPFSKNEEQYPNIGQILFSLTKYFRHQCVR